ncbi:MAG: AtpZ/AtpI family protein [Pirellulales bacterium]|nr:AtpZ/AtpI family protein [Pirellulales bacterium]
MDRRPADERSVISLAYAWASQIIVVAAEMVVPGLIGLWIDQRLGTLVLFAVVGFALGITLAIVHLLRMTSANSQVRKPSDRKQQQK